MEDRYGVKFAKMKGQSVSLFGVFDGIILKHAFISLWFIGYHVYAFKYLVH